jgi:hypothetical protein
VNTAPAPLANLRCFNHTTREAVARCPVCQHYYCRECITEHDDRVICAACLRRAAEDCARPARATWLAASLACAAGFVMLWIFFYLCGSFLLQIPARFHEGTIWVDRF